MRHAYETDNGPGGMSWEIHDEAGKWERSLPRDADLALLAPVEVYTYADWEDHGQEGEYIAPSYVIERPVHVPDDPNGIVLQ